MPLLIAGCPASAGNSEYWVPHVQSRQARGSCAACQMGRSNSSGRMCTQQRGASGTTFGPPLWLCCLASRCPGAFGCTPAGPSPSQRSSAGPTMQRLAQMAASSTGAHGRLLLAVCATAPMCKGNHEAGMSTRPQHHVSAAKKSAPLQQKAACACRNAPHEQWKLMPELYGSVHVCLMQYFA